MNPSGRRSHVMAHIYLFIFCSSNAFLPHLPCLLLLFSCLFYSNLRFVRIIVSSIISYILHFYGFIDTSQYVINLPLFPLSSPSFFPCLFPYLASVFVTVYISLLFTLPLSISFYSPIRFTFPVYILSTFPLPFLSLASPSIS